MWHYIFYNSLHYVPVEKKIPNDILTKLVKKYGPVYYIQIDASGARTLSGEFKKDKEK